MLLASFDHPLALPREERVALLGGKGDGLMRMSGELGLPVPPGFILTTRACEIHRASGWTNELEQALRAGLERLERSCGRRLGDPENPLFVSVRSGAPRSMPGMLDTILNVGLDAATEPGLARENPRLARECRTRLDASFRASLDAAAPAAAASQLRAAVEAVFRSATSPRATAFRRHEGIDGPSLTAVNVQQMVFGNRDARSATGVFFTRDPATGENRPYGDVLFEAQGEDVVSGRHATQSLHVLEERLPEAAAALFSIGRRLERAYADLCEIEFTIESGRLWLLQVRVGKRSPRAALRIAREMADDPEFPLDRREAVMRVRGQLADSSPRTVRRASAAVNSHARDEAAPPLLGRGLGASPGIAVGEIATTIERALDRTAAGRSVVLVRSETSPEDVEGMAVAVGLLTARGGLASHAAVVARGWGIPAVVGLAELAIDAEGIVLAGRRLLAGESISLDGSTGEVFAGALPIETQTAPEAEALLAWARELGIPMDEGESEDATPPDAPASEAPGSTGLEDRILHALAIKGSATREAIAACFADESNAVEATIERLVASGLLVAAKPAGFRLADAAKTRAQHGLESDRMRLGRAAAEKAIAEFQLLDRRMKEAVTDWQLRLVGAERVANDHTDPRWDAEVLDRLSALVADAGPWLASLGESLPRLLDYARRLERARASVRAGDARFIASPRVDSLHGIWFELHEDLIRLAGSTRARELEAGRAG